MTRIKILILITIGFSKLTFSQVEKTIINGTAFKIIELERDDTQQIEYIEIYKNVKKLLTHTITEIDGDCSSENLELGDYEIVNNNIIFYTYWAGGDRMGRNIYPYGFRKQTYTVTNQGKLILKQSVIYIETYVDGDNKHKGIDYLNQSENTEAEKTLRNDYIAKVENLYASTFVLGENKTSLEHDVRTKLAKRIKENTKYWKEVYGTNCNM